MIRPEDIIREATIFYNLRPGEIINDKRQHPRRVEARHAAIILMRKCGYKQKEIKDKMKCSRQWVSYSESTTKEQININPQYKQLQTIHQ